MRKFTSQQFLLVQHVLVTICVYMLTHRGGTEITLIKFAGTCWVARDVAIQCLLHHTSCNSIANKLLFNLTDKVALSVFPYYPPYYTML